MQAQIKMANDNLRQQNDALKAASDENRRQIEATNKLLREAVAKREQTIKMAEANKAFSHFAW